jgi:hypothetical protein
MSDKVERAKWVDIKEIKDPTTTQVQLSGTLKTLAYKDAWKENYIFKLNDQTFKVN